jgi:hypothetical protein
MSVNGRLCQLKSYAGFRRREKVAQIRWFAIGRHGCGIFDSTLRWLRIGGIGTGLNVRGSGVAAGSWRIGECHIAALNVHGSNVVAAVARGHDGVTHDVPF